MGCGLEQAAVTADGIIIVSADERGWRYQEVLCNYVRFKVPATIAKFYYFSHFLVAP